MDPRHRRSSARRARLGAQVYWAAFTPFASASGPLHDAARAHRRAWQWSAPPNLVYRFHESARMGRSFMRCMTSVMASLHSASEKRALYGQLEPRSLGMSGARISHQTKCIGAANQRKVFLRETLTSTESVIFPDSLCVDS